jgi:hypothetical protein
MHGVTKLTFLGGNVSAEPKPTKLATALKYGLAIGAVAVLEPVLVTAAQGVVALGVAIVGGLAIVNFAPWVEMKFRNLGLKAIKHEAKKNPVETLQNQWIDKHKQLQTRAEKVTLFNTATRTFADKVAGYIKKYPEDAQMYTNQLNQMKYALGKQLAGLRQGAKDLDSLRDLIGITADKWEMAQAAIAANEATAEFEQLDPIEFMKQQTALQSVQNAVNQSFAQLDTAIAMDYKTIDVTVEDMPTMLALADNPSQVLNQLGQINVQRTTV